MQVNIQTMKTESAGKNQLTKVKIVKMALFEHENECVCSYTICVILAVIALTISIGIGTYFAYKYMNHWYLKKDVICVKFGTHTQTI